MSDENRKPTVLAAVPFNADEDAIKLYEAFQGFGTSEDVITSILAARNLEQRQYIQEAYESKYKKDLIERLKSELSGDYCEAIEGLIDSPNEFHAKHINGIITRNIPPSGGKDLALLEVLFPMSKMEVDVVKQTYEELFKKSLNSDVQAKVKGPWLDAVTKLIQVGRKGHAPSEVQQDVNILLNLQCDDWTANNDDLMNILLSNNLFYTLSVIKSFNKQGEQPLLDIIDSLPNTDYQEGFKTMVAAASDIWMFYADSLYKSMKGIGTNDAKLIYIVVFRCEMDLGNIADSFQNTYKVSLQTFIDDDTSGGYKRLLMALVGAEPRQEIAAT